MKSIEKVKLHNFKRFDSLDLKLNPEMNLLIGDNESGKSTIIQGIDLVISGSRQKVESIGLDKLFNTNVVHSFLAGKKKYESLPKVVVELFLNEQDNFRLNGKYNSESRVCDGMAMIIEPDSDLSTEIAEVLNDPNSGFPYEYYTVRFKTFSGDNYTGYRNYLKKILIDSSSVSSEYAAREYIKDMYKSNATRKEQAKHENQYRETKSGFTQSYFQELNKKICDYSFSIKTDTKSSLQNDITLVRDGISIDNMGMGKQCFIKTEFALRNVEDGEYIDILLLEEPENHLSHTNMQELVHKISDAHSKQKIISTHSSLICSRLDLRKAILLNSQSISVTCLSDLSGGTAKFFEKSPNNNILQLILSKKVVLVEGDAEYMLADCLFEQSTGSSMNVENIHVISVGGTSFKRYMELAKLLGIKTAVIRDNDADYESNCVDNYIDYVSDSIKVFSDHDDARYTFEVCLYQDNKTICDAQFSGGHIKLQPQDYMLKNKTESAFRLLEYHKTELVVPGYIEEAFKWIKE